VLNNISDDRSPLVLVANDHEWSARSLESVLLPEGYGVIRVKSGSEAVEAISRTALDVILLDLQMPDFSGIDVCRQVREGGRFDPTVPVLITTAGTGGREARLEALEAGAWDFLYQPIDRDILLAKLRVYLSARLATRALRRAQLVDASSGLYTTDGLLRRGEEMIADARRPGWSSGPSSRRKVPRQRIPILSRSRGPWPDFFRPRHDGPMRRVTWVTSSLPSWLRARKARECMAS